MRLKLRETERLLLRQNSYLQRKEKVWIEFFLCLLFFEKLEKKRKSRKRKKRKKKERGKRVTKGVSSLHMYITTLHLFPRQLKVAAYSQSVTVLQQKTSFFHQQKPNPLSIRQSAYTLPTSLNASLQPSCPAAEFLVSCISCMTR